MPQLNTKPKSKSKSQHIRQKVPPAPKPRSLSTSHASPPPKESWIPADSSASTSTASSTKREKGKLSLLMNKITGGSAASSNVAAILKQQRIDPERRSADERIMNHGYSFYGVEDEEEGMQTPQQYAPERERTQSLGRRLAEDEVDDWNTVVEDEFSSWGSDSDVEQQFFVFGAGGVGSRSAEGGEGLGLQASAGFSQPTPRRAYEPTPAILRGVQNVYLEPPGSHHYHSPQARGQSSSPLARRATSPDPAGGSTYSQSSLSMEIGEESYDDYADEESEESEVDEGLQMRSGKWK